MSRLYDRVAPAVIDNALLNKCIKEQSIKDDSGVVAEGSEYMNRALIVSLRLDYKNILKINNLWEFGTLTRLQLDNNIIEKIEGLESLVQLEWLDLSFNNIESIEGLDTLVKLKDLSLAHNRITMLSGLDRLTELHILSIGHNRIKESEQMRYLRPFHRLETLSITGNPCCSNENCSHFVIAHIPSLVYLNYRRITDQMRLTSREMFHEQVEALELKDSEEEKQAQEMRKKEEELALHQRAYVDGVSGDQFFRELFAEDAEASTLHTLPQVEKIMDKFCQTFMENCAQIITIGLEELKNRDSEREDFFSCIEEAAEKNRQVAVTKTKALLDFKKQVMDMEGGDALDAKLAQLENDLGLLNKELMDLEVELVEQMEEVIKEFERNYSEMVSGFVEGVQGHFSQCREAEATYTEELTDICMEIMDKFIKQELDEELPEDARILFSDKESLVSALQTAHDNHALCIDSTEDSIINRAKGDLKKLVEEISKKEMQRDRKRVAEIRHFCQSVRDEIIQTAGTPDLEP